MRIRLLCPVLVACTLASSAAAEDTERQLFDAIAKLRAAERTAIVEACQRIRAEKEEFITEDDELAKAEADLEHRLKRYRTICLRLLQVSKNRWSAPTPSIEGLPQRIHDEIEGKLADADGDEKDRLFGQADAWIRLAYLDDAIGLEESRRHPVNAARRLRELAEEIARYEQTHVPLLPVQDSGLRNFCIGVLQRVALADYKRLAVSGPLVDPRTGQPIAGHTRTLLAGNALTVLSEYLARKGKATSDLQSLFWPRKKQLDISKQIEQEVDSWSEYRLATFLDAGMDPPIQEYFLAVASVIRFEQARVDEWFNKDYVGGKPWDIGLGKAMRVSNAWGTGDAGIDAVNKRIRKFRAESDAAAWALDLAAKTPRPESLDERARKLLESRGYIVTGAAGRKAYAVPKNPRAISQSVGKAKEELDLPGASWLDVITPKSVGIMVASVIVPELLAVEAEALAGAVLTSERGIMAVRVLAEIGADIVVSGSLEAITMEKEERASLDQLLLESAVLGGSLQIIGALGKKGVSAGLRKVADAERDTALHKLMRDESFRAKAETYIAESFEFASENALSTVFQAYVNDQDIDFDSIRSSLLQSAVSRKIAKRWDKVPSRLPSRKEIARDFLPDWMRKKCQDDEPLRKQFTAGVRRRLEALAVARKRMDKILAEGQGPEARKIFLGLIRGDLTRRELSRIYAEQPERWGPVATEVAGMIDIYAHTMIRKARTKARNALDGYVERKRAEIKSETKNPAEQEARLKRLEERYQHESALLDQEPVAPGSKGPTSDVDRSSASVLLRRTLKRMYEMRRQWYGDGEVPTAARALDVNEYINVMPFIAECRGYATRMRDAPTDPKAEQGMPKSHGDAKEALSISALLVDRSPAEVDRYLRGRQARIEKQVFDSVPARKRKAEREKRLKKDQELVDAAKASIDKSREAMADVEVEVRKEYPGAEDSEIEIRVRDRLYDKRMIEVNDLQFDLARMEKKLGPDHGESIALRAKIDRMMSVAMRDGIETYSQPVGIDIIVNAVQSSKVRGKDGKLRKMKVADRIDDPNFTLKKELAMYSEQDMACMLNDQYKFILEHVRGFQTGHETPYETGRALGKYIERAFLARKIWNLDIEAVRKRQPYDPTRRLLEVSQKLVASKNDPDALRQVLADFATKTPADAQNGLFELFRVMDRALPGLRGIVDGPALGEARWPEAKDSAGNPVYVKHGALAWSRRSALQTLLRELGGSEVLAKHLHEESKAVDAELARHRTRIKATESLAKEFRTSDWARVLQLRKRLDSVNLVLSYLPWTMGQFSVARAAMNERRTLKQQIEEARDRFRGREPVDRQELYRKLPRYAWLKDRVNYLLRLTAMLKVELPVAEEAARREREAAAKNLGGDWFLVTRRKRGRPEYEMPGEVVPDPDEEIEELINRVRITHEQDKIRLETVWGMGKPYAGRAGGSFEFVVKGEYRRGRIVGAWAEPPLAAARLDPDDPEPPVVPADPDKEAYGVWEAQLDTETMTLRILPTTRQKEFAAPWTKMVLVRRPTPEIVEVVKRGADGKKNLSYGVRRPPEVGEKWDRDRIGILHGPWTSWNTKGEPTLLGRYVDGIREGDWILGRRTFGKTDSATESGAFTNGLRTGVWTRRFNDTVLETTTYRLGVRQGAMTRRRTSTSYREGVQHGESSTEDEGRPPTKVTYRCGFVHGPASYPQSGADLREGAFAFGTRTGEWRAFNRDGSRNWTSAYAASLMHGPDSHWGRSKHKLAEGTRHYGLRVGDWTFRDKQGVKHMTAHYEVWPTEPSATFFPTHLIHERVKATVARIARLEQVVLLDDAFQAMFDTLSGEGVKVDLTREGRIRHERDGVVREGGSYDNWSTKGPRRLEAMFYEGKLMELSRWHSGGKHVAFKLTEKRIEKQRSWEQWRADGTPEFEATFSLDGYLDSYVEWYEDGTTARLALDRDRWAVHDAAGKKHFSFQLRSGALVEYREWYEAGGARCVVTVGANQGSLSRMEIAPEARPDEATVIALDRTIYTGTRTALDEKERPKTRSSWRMGQKHGPQERWTYDGEGRLLEHQSDLFESGAKAGSRSHVIHWRGGEVKSQEYHTKDGKLHGVMTNWHANGQKQFEVDHRGDKRVGAEKRWYDNGKLQSVTTYNDGGEHHGQATNWDAQGQLTTKHHCVGGKEHGEWIDLKYDAGKLVSKRVRVYEVGKLMSDKTIETAGD